MYTIRKQFSFSAAHHLPHLPEGHPCKRPHGHNYVVEVILQSHSLERETSFVEDYRNLDWFKDWLNQFFDHRDLNQIVTWRTTAENLANHLYYVCKERHHELLKMVRVSETPKTWAEYSE